MRAVLQVFQFCFHFLWDKKFTINENISFVDYASGIRLLDCTKLSKNWKIDYDIKFFWQGFLSLVRLSYWSKFHVNMITGAGVMTIFFYKGLTRNSEIRNNLVWFLDCFWRLSQFRNTKFGANVSNKMLLKAADLKQEQNQELESIEAIFPRKMMNF